MKPKNPKILAGAIAIAVLVALAAVLVITLIPVAGEVQREMSLTPTPLPPMPDTVRATTVAAGAATPEPPLRNGSTGEKVKDLQTRLQELGYYQGEIDGQFGAGTRDAVVAFQQRNGLDADGLAGEETLRVLHSPDAIPYSEE